ncbi:hypothetical protein TCDM_13643 [Trypanosoma cruzi Dm28c]|uniref:Target of rapamycin (TOR) kinase 1 n=2 Tax=Trypanosoma cruzi TaxID=5693 RepID=V5AMM8_TRYCR|nr:hypothetical protein TCDM_13643 [Trypanosoma cruzi Dm28c]PWU90446.1 hypothetical protein C4B63_50g205 [Trypanosoma cruzi]
MEDSNRRRASLRKAGIIEDASSTITGGWIIPFSVVEEKTTGLRRRWIAWPHDKSRDDPYEANAPLLHISHYLSPVMAEAFSCLDLKVSFSRVSLPQETRHLFRCRPLDGRHVVSRCACIWIRCTATLLPGRRSSLWGLAAQLPAALHAPAERSVLSLSVASDSSQFPAWQQHPNRPREFLSPLTPSRRWSHSALACWRCTTTSARRFVPCRTHWRIEGTQLALHFPRDAAVFHAVRPLTNKPRLHDPSRRTASMPGTWTSSLQ